VAEPVNVSSQPPTPAAPVAPSIPRARVVWGDKIIARVLRTGATTAGICFVVSIVANLLPASEAQGWVVDFFRRSGITLLIVTPVMRLIAAGVMLGLKGEYRYTVYAATILLLLSFAMAAGLAA